MFFFSIIQNNKFKINKNSLFDYRKQNDGTMEAIKLSDWYHFLPVPKYKPLDAEQAEEEFLRWINKIKIWK